MYSLTFGSCKALRSGVIKLYVRGLSSLTFGLVFLTFGGGKALRLGVKKTYVLGL